MANNLEDALQTIVDGAVGAPVIEATRLILRQLVVAVPIEQLRLLLSEEAIARANQMANTAEHLKFDR